MGYIGGGVLFLINVLMYLKPELFGIADGTTAIKIAFLSVAIWWAVFSIPVFLFVKEPKFEDAQLKLGAAVKAGWKQFTGTFKEIRHLKVVGMFLLAYWFYIDGVDTIIRMAISIGTALEFEASALIVALLIVQFVAFGGSLLYSLLARKIGAKTSLYIGIAGYSIITMVGFFMNQVWHFYALAVAIGLFQGGIQAISRSLYSRIIPKNKAAEFYGFFNLLGKFAAVIGPSLMGVIALMTKNAKDLTMGSMTLGNMGIRYGVLSILVLFIIGGLLLRKVDIEEGKRQVKYLK
jgi:UMF1 family MFS transporter